MMLLLIQMCHEEAARPVGAPAIDLIIVASLSHEVQVFRGRQPRSPWKMLDNSPARR
jgi:hypothetical protein